MQVAEEFDYGFAVSRIQISGRLVGEHQRLSCNSTRHSDALLLASGKLAGQVPGPMGHADLLQRFVHAGLRSAAFMPR